MRVHNFPLIVFILSLSCLGKLQSANAPPGSLSLKIVNRAGAPIELFWIDTINLETKGNLTKQFQKPLRNGTDAVINTFQTHTFVAKFIRDSVSVNITMGPRDQTVELKYDKRLKTMNATVTTKIDELIQNLNNATAACEKDTVEGFPSCMANEVKAQIDKVIHAKDTIKQYRNLISNRLRNYTCMDSKMNTTKSIKSSNVKIHDKLFTAEILFESKNSKIWTIDNFVSEDECKIMKDYAAPRLEPATVTSADGLYTVSKTRKAQQTAYTSHRVKFDEDPLWPLYARSMYSVNEIAKYRLSPVGQEDIAIIQYNPGDEYLPHCDGACDNSIHRPTGRVATALIYCEVAEEGGGTTFTNADVFIKPKFGMATFFSYKGPDGRMDDGYMEHSGCPVIKGEKWIATIWMRDGVTAKKNWRNYDPMGIERLQS